MHAGGKLYKCHVCGRAFVQSSNYQSYILTHKTKEERQQKCDLCARELLSRCRFKNHRKRFVKMLTESYKKYPRRNVASFLVNIVLKYSHTVSG